MTNTQAIPAEAEINSGFEPVPQASAEPAFGSLSEATAASPSDAAPPAKDPAIASPVAAFLSEFTFEAAATSTEFPSMIPKIIDAAPPTPLPVPPDAVDSSSASRPVILSAGEPAAAGPPAHLQTMAAIATADVADELSHFAHLSDRPRDDLSGGISISAQIGNSDISEPGSKPRPSVSPASGSSSSSPSTVKTFPGHNSSSVTAASADDAGSPRVVSMLLFVIVLSYASAMTLAFGYLLYKNQFGAPHQLESLPDIVPPMKNGQVAMQLVPESAELPNGHTLALGESRRFGNVRVTPLRVTKEPLRFEYYTGDSKKSRAPTEPVLKLWVRFENVSRDQSFSPLDRKLLLSNVADGKHVGEVRSNQFVIRRADKPKSRPRVQIYDLPADGEWDFEGFRAPPRLSPGETWDTYIPTTVEGLKQLEGNLVWRVHFRKGYHPQSNNGVTTLFEVRFNSNQIENGTT